MFLHLSPSFRLLPGTHTRRPLPRSARAGQIVGEARGEALLPGSSRSISHVESAERVL